MQNVHFTPPELARLFGVNESTIKRWIDRGLLTASCTPGGHRRVSQADLQTFLRTQKQARKYSYVLKRFEHKTTQASWREYYELHKNFQATKARAFLTGALLACGSAHNVLTQIVVPTLIEIGEAWRRGEVDIADEHRVTFLVRSDLLILETMLPIPPDSAPTVLLACVPNENHEIVLHMLTLIAREAHWNTLALGINVPAPEITRTCAVQPITAVALAKVYQGATTTPYVRTVKESIPPHTPILLGGAGWRRREQKACEALEEVTFLPTFQSFVTTLNTIRNPRTATIT